MKTGAVITAAGHKHTANSFSPMHANRAYDCDQKDYYDPETVVV